LGSKAEDIFYITDGNDKMITDVEVLERLQQLLLAKLAPKENAEQAI